MADTTFEAHLGELVSSIERLPEPQRPELMRLVDETRARHKGNQESARKACTALDDWRVSWKYLLFDIEARLRERQSSQTGGDDTPEK